MKPPALQLMNVTKSYPGSPPVVALDTASVTIRSGEMVAVTGPSGSGKSTMLHIMGTLDRPTSGVVHVDGIDTSTVSDKRLAGIRAVKIGFVFQQFHLLEGTTALENVGNGLLYLGVPPSDRKVAARRALERVGLGHRTTHQPNKMSGGERQRVAIARALVHEPAFVLADEPTGNLDSKSGAAVMQLLANLNAEGTTIVVITHDRTIAASLPRQVHLLDGQIVQDSALEVVA